MAMVPGGITDATKIFGREAASVLTVRTSIWRLGLFTDVSCTARRWSPIAADADVFQALI
jgi:hypothetical protein